MHTFKSLVVGLFKYIHIIEGLRGKTIIVNIPKMFSIAVLKWDSDLFPHYGNI